MMRAERLEIMKNGCRQENGFALIPGVFGRCQIDELIEAVANIRDARAARRRNGVFAIRNLLSVSPVIRNLAILDPIRAIVAEHFPRTPLPVRGTFFDKTAGANWLVPWHQDLTICLSDRRDVAGYGPWSVKGGVWHVQPPVSVLDDMLSVRIHFDDCDQSNGALRVLPGTHTLGRLTPEKLEEQQNAGRALSCEMQAGGVMLMKPLLVHASSAASAPLHRRVIHIDYACGELDGGLQWLTGPVQVGLRLDASSGCFRQVRPLGLGR